MNILPKWLSRLIFGEAANDTRTPPAPPEAAATSVTPIYRPGPDWTPDEVRHFELVGRHPTSVTHREREKEALAAAKAQFDEIKPDNGGVTLSAMEMTSEVGGIKPLFVNIDGLIVGAGGRPVHVANLYEHDFRTPSRIVVDRAEKAGRMLIGQNSIVVYDNDGSVYLGSRYENVQGARIDLAAQLERVGYRPYSKSGPEVDIDSPDHKVADPLEVLLEKDFFVISKMQSRFRDPDGESWLPNHAFHTEMMTKLGRQPLSETAFTEAAKFRGLSARELKIPPRGSEPGGTGGPGS
ncbi:MAG: hypothetical protein EBQ96_08535 [Proteobacteria bacterium]|nr:hypothetical protein [Pseudomonadota bacterium]